MLWGRQADPFSVAGGFRAVYPSLDGGSPFYFVELLVFSLDSISVSRIEFPCFLDYFVEKFVLYAILICTYHWHFTTLQEQKFLTLGFVGYAGRWFDASVS